MLPFDADVLIATLATYHRAFAPGLWLAPAIALAAFVLAAAGTASGRRAVLLLLAACWLWNAAAWHFGTFAQLNFAAPAYGLLFALQAALLGWQAARGGLSFGARADWTSGLGVLLAVAALLAWPLIDRLQGWPWSALRLPGIDPCPTTLLTLGVLMLSRPPSITLMIVPVLWAIIAGAMGWVLAVWPDPLLPVFAVIVLASAVWTKRQALS